MAVSTVSDIIRGALQNLGVLAAGETPSSDDSALGLEALNGLLDQYLSQRLQLYFSNRTTWTITQTASFTVGSGGTVNVARPMYVDAVSYRDTSLSTPVEIPLLKLTDDAYADWAMKTQTTSYPTAFWFNPTFSSGLATLFLLPICTASNLQGVLYSPGGVARYAAITDSFSLPPGYERMLRTNLAVELSMSFDRAPSGTLSAAAVDSMAAVKRSNTVAHLNDLQIEGGALVQTESGGGLYNILTDQ